MHGGMIEATGQGAAHQHPGTVADPFAHLLDTRGRAAQGDGNEVDGGSKEDNIARVAAAGADTFVSGSAIFGTPAYKATIAAMRAQLATV